jgi:hypothetical protein
MQPVMTKKELERTMRLFLKDKNRGISIKLFGELCGVSGVMLRDVFIYRVHPLTERMQRRVSKGYMSWKSGKVAVMENRDGTRFVKYRAELKPFIEPSSRLQLVNGRFAVKLGMKNIADYSALTLDEQLERG